MAEIAGRTLLDHAVTALAERCDAVVVCGRDKAPAPALPDWPAPGMGPLGGLAAALNHALAGGFVSVLSCGVDCLGLPPDLLARLSPAPRYLRDLPVVGHWPAHAAGALEELLSSTRKHSLRAFAEAIGARATALPAMPANINTPADLTAAAQKWSARP